MQFQRNLKANTMKSMTAKTYLSAWKGFNKFLLCLDYKPEHWELPAQIELLEILMFEFERMFKTQYYLEILYKTIFLIRYYGLLRIGEMTMSPHTLKAKKCSYWGQQRQDTTHSILIQNTWCQ